MPTGLKRLAASFLTLILGILQLTSYGAVTTPVLLHVAGFLGITGVLSATASKTIALHALLTLSALLTATALLLSYIPDAADYAVQVQHLAVIISAFTVGAKVEDVLKTRNP